MRVRGFGDVADVVIDRVWIRDDVCTVPHIFDELAAERVIAPTTVFSTMDDRQREDRPASLNESARRTTVGRR